MPRNGSGVYSLPQPPFVSGTVISSAAMNSDLSDIATALTGSLPRDGQVGMSGVFAGISGNSGSPGITFTGDKTSGLFLSAVGAPGFASNGFGLLLNTNVFSALTVTIQNGGTGYAVNDTIILSGGSPVNNCILQVSSVVSTVITGATIVYPGYYLTAPTNPVSQGSTDGAGTGATFNLTFNVPASNNFVPVLTDLNNLAPWKIFGASTYMGGLMTNTNGFDLASAIGGANLQKAINASSAQTLPVPEGYLTLSSNIPVISGDVASATSLFYTPYTGVWVVIHNGVSLQPYQLTSQLVLTLTSSQASNNIYDIFLAYNGGTPVIGTGPSWLASGGSVTAGSCARGSGAGSTALQRLNGVWTNQNSMSLIWNTGSGNTTITVPANQGVYLGSVFIDGTGGQVSCYRSYGQSRKWGLWNAYNRTNLYLKAGDPTASWSYTTNLVRASNGSSANSLTTFQGLAEEPLFVDFNQRITVTASSSRPSQAMLSQAGIGLNSIVAFTANGDVGITSAVSGVNTTSLVGTGMSYCKYTALPSLGIQVFSCCETTPQADDLATFFGTEQNMVLQTIWRG